MNPRSARYFVQPPPLGSEILEQFFVSIHLSNRRPDTKNGSQFFMSILLSDRHQGTDTKNRDLFFGVG
jgi:hypothetical protein